MKFALGIHGSRGDVEPFAAIGLELQRRGHEVRMAVPPNMIGFTESAGLTAVAYGPSSQAVNEEEFIRNFWDIRTPVKIVRAGKHYLGEVWAEMGTTLTTLAAGTDLLLTGMVQQGLAVNAAEYHGIPLAELHCFPVRVNSHILPAIPSPLIRSGISALWWAHWRMTKPTEDDQRRQLGLPKAIGPSTRRIVERGSLEIQAYDDLFFPGLSDEWSRGAGRRPFVGALTMNVPTAADDAVADWCAAGTPPIYFGFGSMPVRSFDATVRMIGDACAELGERALICSGAHYFDERLRTDRVMIVDAMNHRSIFPKCRAVVHHGGAGTTAAGLRAGIPTLILWVTADQPIWAAQIRRLKVGSARRFSATTSRSLAADLRDILTPQHVANSRTIAGRLTPPDISVRTTADLLEDAAKLRRVA
ncbi:glycosyltransferase [Candidatus Mycobacterium wuenschmannii]|uniref:Glycosyltransferase n=1 Tax=Candidatus Mycobacterium wuenschmannii TaxID=3027808 RepID=A0ABY8W2Q4_9MYCO|nr:glycosyltransferase [Candidatus Mycobacterium wuenschmannii]WIM88717.1 glycosyltransferase [Candidatus Mycobacterium wuenschmannii]